MATSNVAVTPGTGKNLATHSFSEDAITKELSRVVLSDNAGADISPATSAQAGSLTETAPASDTASSGLNGRLQRIAQRLTSMIALLPTALGAGGGLKVDGSGTALPVTGTITAVTAISNALPAGTNAIGKLAANSGVDIGDVDVTTVPTDPFGANADAASATGSISAKLRGIATALGVTAFDLGSGTGGSRTLRTILDTTQIASVLDCSTTVTRPADTSAYTANDAFANSTSAPTAGGFTLTSAAAVSGGGGIITDAVIVASAGTLYQGEIWLFDGAVTAVNDNAAFALSDADALLCLGKIPFTLAVEATNNSSAHVSGLNIGFHCVGSANLRFLVKILNAPTPGNAETLTVRIKGIRS